MQAANQDLEAFTVFVDGLLMRLFFRLFFWHFFFHFYFLDALQIKVIIIAKQFILLSIDILWALLRAHFHVRLTARDRSKTSLSRAQTYLHRRR